MTSSAKFPDVFYQVQNGFWLLLSDALRNSGTGGQCACHFPAKEVDAALNQHLTAGLIQQSTSPYSSPLVVVPKISGGVRITVNYKELNDISSLSQLPIPRVDQVLNSLGKGRIFSLFDLLSSFHQIIAHKDTVPLTAFCTFTGLCEWLVMPQGSSASARHLVGLGR